MPRFTMPVILKTVHGFAVKLTCAAPVRANQIADQRTARYPVTFALHVSFLREHNRCCVEVAPDLGFSGDEVGRLGSHVMIRQLTKRAL